ncbi:hypothetical protein ANN_06227, partial [Periplaneta americana]
SDYRQKINFIACFFSTREEIKRRINIGNACYYSVEKLLSSILLSKNLKVGIYKTVILPVLYGCETSTLTLREKHRLRVFENKVLRKIFGAKRDEVTGEWRKLHNTELHALYSSPDIIRNIKSRRLRWAGHVARMGESRNAYRVLVGRQEGKRPLGRPGALKAICKTRKVSNVIRSKFQISSDEVEKELDVSGAWENILYNIKIAAEQSIGYYETKKKKPCFDEDCCTVVERRKRGKLKFLQDPVEANRDYLFQ